MKRSKLRENGGFTLVELIVVIAILGILAGVGGVAYAGYVQKANQAVDETLYKDIIYAGALGSYQDPGVTGIVTVTTTGSTAGGANPEVIDQWMTDAFGSDWEHTVKYRTDAYANSSVYGTIKLPGQIIELTEEQKQMVQDYIQSNFYGNEEELLQSVGDLTGMFSSWLAGGNSLAGFIDDYDAFKSTYGLTDASTPEEVANAVVLYVASKASGMDSNAILNEVQRGNIANVMSEYGELPSAALIYGVMTGYANSKYASESFKTEYAKKPESISDVLTLFEKMKDDSGMNEYMSGTSEKNVLSDMNGYLGALQLVNDNADKFDITDPNAFNNDTTLALLQAILANGSK
ncbi:type IV pilin protein [Intestinimonas massiliensis (ex Afouda et al. 2020)]|uniref:type IV pilin protein n=1 Tax=Intestinimonas massiliensis (ex Afouda et al. 2020) TaxID=1673721 RepID=UPI001030B92D|nr:prepilin-type N-terminal cleavage/methylation domain-containing protein [Intestinimonas massiliensis (ex Afouda et al. 2020)]